MRQFGYIWLLLLLSTGLFAQKHSPEMRQEMRTYLKTNVMPVLRAQRAKLEPQISEADRQLIGDIRQRQKALRQEALPAMQQLKTKRQSGQPLTEADRAQLKGFKAKRDAVQTERTAVVQRYDAPITSLLNEIAPQRTQWEADLKAIAEKHGVQPGTGGPRKGRGHGKGAKHGKHGKDGASIGKLFDKNAFLFMPVKANKPTTGAINPGTYVEDEDLTDLVDEWAAEEEGEFSPQLSPNPANGSSKVSFNLSAPQLVTVSLTDDKGTILRQVFKGEKGRGEHAIEIDVKDLGTGTYYCLIETPTTRETKRLVVSN